MRVGVTGGTGFIGEHLHSVLRDRGDEVIIIARNSATVSPGIHTDSGTEIVEASLGELASLTDAFSGCDAIAHLAGINYQRGGQTYHRVHVRGTANVVDAAVDSGAKRVLLTSYLRARPACGSGYLESKWAAEELVRMADIPGIILKPPGVIGPGDQMLTQLARWLLTVPCIPRVGIREHPLRPLAVEDLVGFTAEALQGDQLEDRTIALLGPEEVTLSQLVGRIGDVVGVDPVIFPAPVPMHLLSGFLFEHLLDPPLVTRAGVRMLAEGMTAAAPAKVTETVDQFEPVHAPTRQYIADSIGAVNRFGLSDIGR